MKNIKILTKNDNKKTAENGCKEQGRKNKIFNENKNLNENKMLNETLECSLSCSAAVAVNAAELRNCCRLDWYARRLRSSAFHLRRVLC